MVTASPTSAFVGEKEAMVGACAFAKLAVNKKTTATSCFNRVEKSKFFFIKVGYLRGE